MLCVKCVNYFHILRSFHLPFFEQLFLQFASIYYFASLLLFVLYFCNLGFHFKPNISLFLQYCLQFNVFSFFSKP